MKSQMPPGAPEPEAPAENPSGHLLSLPVNSSGKCRRGDQIKFPPNSLPRSEKRAQPSCCTLKSSIPGAPGKLTTPHTHSSGTAYSQHRPPDV